MHARSCWGRLGTLGSAPDRRPGLGWGPTAKKGEPGAAARQAVGAG